MSNIKLKNHYWHARSVFDPTQNKTQEALNAQNAELIASSTVASTGTTGATAAYFIADAAGLPLKSLVVTLPDATQEGSGDPSPSNVRTITGITSASAVISPTQTASDGETISVTFPAVAGTVYGGTIDLLNGVLTVDRIGKKIKDISWTYNSNNQRFQSSNVSPSVKPAANQYQIVGGLLCEAYKNYAPLGQYALQDNGIAVTNNGTILIKDTRYVYASTFTAAMGETLIVYPLAEPIVYQIERQPITTLLGVNNIWSDTGIVTVTYGAYIQAANEHAADLAMSRAGRGYITPEQFGAVGDGETDDSTALQACLNQGGAILLSREYNIGTAELEADTQIDLVCTADSKIIAASYPSTYIEGNDHTTSPVLTLKTGAAKSRIIGMRVFSAADQKPSIVVNNRKDPSTEDDIPGSASNRYAIFANADGCVFRDLYGKYCNLIRLGDYNKDFVIDGLYGDYIELAIFAANATNVIVNNVRVNLSKLVKSDLYHVFYFCNPVNCTFSNVVIGASGNVNYINSDIFHFNHASSLDLGGDVTITNVTVLDNSVKRLTQIKNNVRAYFSNCTGKFSNTVCLVSNSKYSDVVGNPSATFAGCTFEITVGDSSNYGFRITGATGRIWLRGCKIIDDSAGGYLVSGGVIADGCTFEVAKWKVNVYSAATAPKFAKFHNCVIYADALAIDEGHPDNDGGGISPNNSAFTSEYHNCKFVFTTTPTALISGNNLSTILVIGGSVENCSKIYSSQGSNKNVIVINLPFKNNGTWSVYNRLSGGT